MNYLDELAREIYRAAHPGRELPAGQARLYRGYAVLARTVGERVSCANVHDAWVAWAMESTPDHPSLLPLPDLAADVRIKDRRYAEAIRQVVASWADGTVLG